MGDGHIEMAQEAVEEARMMLPGIQALFGFLLIAVFNERFAQPPGSHKPCHLVAIILVAMAMALIITPAAYHRQVEPGNASRFFVVQASRLVTCAMLPLMVAVCLEIFILSHIILGHAGWSTALAIALFCLFGWFMFPWTIILRRSKP